MANILIAEDDPAIAGLIEMNLQLVGHTTFCAPDGLTALERARSEKPDIALVDIMLPELDGWELTKKLTAMEIPVMIVSARADIADRVRGLRTGADDYIVKPFESVELLARVDALLRRTQRAETAFTLDGVTVRLEAGYAEREGKAIPLTNREFEVLCALIRNRNITLSREKLLSMVWGYDFMGETRTVDLHVQRVRKKLGWEKHIVTAYRQGYRLEC